jgi:hypothetical protein
MTRGFWFLWLGVRAASERGRVQVERIFPFLVKCDYHLFILSVWSLFWMLEVNVSRDLFLDEISEPTLVMEILRVFQSRVGSSRSCLCDTYFTIMQTHYLTLFISRLVENGQVQESHQSQSKWVYLVARLRVMAVIHIEDNGWAAWCRPLSETITWIFTSVWRTPQNTLRYRSILIIWNRVLVVTRTSIYIYIYTHTHTQ